MCVSISYPLLKKDEDLIENVLRRATALPRLHYKPNNEHLAAIKIARMRCRGKRMTCFSVQNSR